jgi:hypothetical protein
MPATRLAREELPDQHLGLLLMKLLEAPNRRLDYEA